MTAFCQHQGNILLQQKLASYKPKTIQLAITASPSSIHFSGCLKSSSLVASCSPTAKCCLQALPGPTTMDLKLSIQRCSTVTPYEETERKTMFLSDFDQYLNFNVGTILFFTADSNFSPDTVADRLETAFRKSLVHYDYLAGRLRFNTEEGRLEIDCNSAGAGFTVISSELAMAELGNLADSCPAFQQLETMRPENCLFVIQVISFRCGGFAMAVCMNHVTFDGSSLKMFLTNLTSLLATDRLSILPCNDRRTFSSAARLTFPHLEYIKTDWNIFQLKSIQSETKVFRLGKNDIARLKQRAMEDGTVSKMGSSLSRFKVVTAHVWRCRGLARNSGNDPDKKSTIHIGVDMRSRLKREQLPESFTGNAAIESIWTTTCRKLEEGPFSHLVEMISGAVSNITEEHIKSVIKSGKWLAGFAYEDVALSSWMNLGLEKHQYPWGRPKCACPLVLSETIDFVVMFPDEESIHGANLLVTLPVEEMRKFEALFQKLM